MAIATSTTLTAAINTIFLPGIVKTFYEGTPLLKFLGWPFPQAEGGDSIDWKLNYAGGTASIINEGDALPAPSNLTFADMTVSPSLVTQVRTITGHAQDFMGQAYFDGVKAELDGGVTAVLHKVEEKCVSLLEAAINDDTSYGGQTRATVHADSDVTAGGSAALTLAMLSEMYETLQIDPRAVEYDPNDHFLFSAPEQLTAYTELAGIIVTGDAEASGANLPYTGMQGDAVMDLGKLKHSHRYNKLPWYTFATATNTLVYLSRKSDIITRLFHAAGQPPIQIKPLGRTEDADSFQFRCHIGLAHRDPYRAARIEALTT
jgi:hypothetical protein